MICKVRKTVEKYGMFDGVNSVAVGVSGGADSMCLLHILGLLKKEYGFTLKAVHVNHNIRGQEAKRDENSVVEFCRKENIECLVFSEDIPALSKEMGVGEEECGRIVRYRCFEKAGCDAVAVAHSLSDSIETMIFNLIRGTGSKGLCGIPPVREPNILRPLIECSREEIEQYCKLNNIDYVTDSTNLEDDYTRNFIRHNIIGSFSRINQGYKNNIASLMQSLSVENDYLEFQCNELLKKCKTEKGYDAHILKNEHPALRRRAVAEILRKNMNKSFSSAHVLLADEIIEKGEGKLEIATDLYISVHLGILSVERKYEKVTLAASHFENNIAVFGDEKFFIEDISSEDYKYNSLICFDRDKIKGELILSGRLSGDKFTFKKRRITKSLKKLFNEMKIPEEKRDSIAILRDGENIVWIQGVGVNSAYIPDETTKNYCIIKKEG